MAGVTASGGTPSGGAATGPGEPEDHERAGRSGEGAASRRRRPRRRAGAAPATFARKKSKPDMGNPPPESPEDVRDFDEGFWRDEMPPHWG